MICSCCVDYWGEGGERRQISDDTKCIRYNSGDAISSAEGVNNAPGVDEAPIQITRLLGRLT